MAIITVEVRDKNNNLYHNKKGDSIKNIATFEQEIGEKTLQAICENFESVCKKGSVICVTGWEVDEELETYSIVDEFTNEKNLEK